jgi:hypothetical protein
VGFHLTYVAAGSTDPEYGDAGSTDPEYGDCSYAVY